MSLFVTLDAQATSTASGKLNIFSAAPFQLRLPSFTIRVSVIVVASVVAGCSVTHSIVSGILARGP